MLVEVDIPGSEESTSSEVIEAVALGALGVAHEDSTLSVGAKFGLQLQGNVSPAVRSKNTQVGEVWLTTIHNLKWDHAGRKSD